MAFGIPSTDQINGIVAAALDKVSGIEQQTSIDLQASITQEITSLLKLEQQAASDLPAVLAPVLEAVNNLRQEIAEIRLLVSRGLELTWKPAFPPPVPAPIPPATT